MIKFLLAMLISFSILDAKIVLKNDSKFVITLVGRKAHILEPYMSGSFDTLPCNESGRTIFKIQHHLFHFLEISIKYHNPTTDLLTLSIFHDELILISKVYDKSLFNVPISALTN